MVVAENRAFKLDPPAKFNNLPPGISLFVLIVGYREFVFNCVSHYENPEISEHLHFILRGICGKQGVICLHWLFWSSIATWSNLKTWRHVHIIFALLFRTSGLGFIRERRRGCLVTPLGSTWLRPGPDSSWLELCFTLWRMLKYVYHAENISFVMSHLVYIWTC